MNELLKTKAIDWQLCLKLAAGNEDIAEEILVKFLEDLPASEQAITTAFTAKNWDDLLHQVHRLHGACCYCGVPQLKDSVTALETALKNKSMHVVPELYKVVITCIRQCYSN